MVDGAAELFFELASGVLEGVVDWLGDNWTSSGDCEADNDHAIARYADSLYEVRPPVRGPEGMKR